MPAYDVDLSFARAQSLIGGAAGSVPYQTATSSTTFLPIASTSGYLLSSLGSGVQWTAPPANVSSATPTSLGTVFGYTTGNGNTSVGCCAGNTTQTGANNIAVGCCSLITNTTGNNNVAIGSLALRLNTGGIDNVAISSGALSNNTTGFTNIAIGKEAMLCNLTGYSNIALGCNALRCNSAGNNNIGIGENSFAFAPAGSCNVGFGPCVLLSNSGNCNVAIAHNALRANTLGCNNIGIGVGAGCNITTGVNNTVIGTLPAAAGCVCTVLIGAGACERIRVDNTGLYINGTAFTGGASNWTVKTANYTAVNGDRIIADTSGGTFTITLPATPATGANVVIADGSDWATINLTIARNSSTIEGVAEDLICDLKGSEVNLVYDGVTWEIYVGSINQLPPQTGNSGKYLTTNGTTATWADVVAGLSVNNNTTTNSDGYYPTMTTAVSGSVTTATVSSTKLYFNPSTGQLNATNFNSLSDANKKDNVVTIDHALEKVLAMRGVYFTWADTGLRSTGVIAQELEQVLPEAVNTAETGEKSVAYGNIIGILIEAIKSLQAEINILKDS